MLTLGPAYLLARHTAPVTPPAAMTGAMMSQRAARTEARVASIAEIEAHIAAVAARHGVSPRLVAAIIEAESEFKPWAVSRKGAQGLMQLMPRTASSLEVANAFDPYANIDGGVRHLRRLMDRFKGNLPLVLAAYNAGETAVHAYRGVPPYRETRRYVARILRRVGREVVTTAHAAEVRKRPPAAAPLRTAPADVLRSAAVVIREGIAEREGIVLTPRAAFTLQRLTEATAAERLASAPVGEIEDEEADDTGAENR